MSGNKPGPRWLFLITPRWLGWHLFAVLATWGMLWLGDWQFHRAEGGNALSWAYTFEWPIFAVMGLGFWAKTIVDEWKERGAPATAVDADGPVGAAATSLPSPRRATVPAGADDEDEDDPELDAYNAYLARLNKQVQGHGRWHGLR